MDIDEAIKTNKELYDFHYDEGDPTDHEAIQLGIEALEPVRSIQEAYKEPNYFRTLHKMDLHKPLPSETEGE